MSEAKRLRFDTAPLKDARGAEKNPGGGCSPRPTSSRLCMPRSATASTPACTVPSATPGWRAKEEAAWSSIWALDGSAAGSHAGGSATTRARGVRSRKAAKHGRPADAVEDGVVHLGDERRPLPFQPFDDVHLPQRPVRVEAAAHDRRHETVELGCATRRGQAGPHQVVVQLELRVVDPDRVVQPEGDPDGTLPQWAPPGAAVAAITRRICA